MNILEIENKRIELLTSLKKWNSSRVKLLLLNEFFQTLFECKDQNVVDSYLLEFSDKYLKNLSEWNVFFLPPELSKKVIKLAKDLKAHNAFKPFKDNFSLIISRLENSLQELEEILNGSSLITIAEGSKINFPVIEERTDAGGNDLFGYVESLTVKINKGESKDKFIIVPSLIAVEEKLETQIRISWSKAIEIVGRYKRRINKYHDIIINFDRKLGEYTGNSLGVALVLAFLQELFIFYNTPINLKVPSDLAFTGGLDENAKVIPVTNKAYIIAKIKSIFYSQINKIILHRNDEEVAKTELIKLLKKYPDRKLKLIAVEDFDDLINRRDIVEIKKQNPVIRSSKFIKKQKIAVSVLLIAILGLLYANIDFDNNPSYVTNMGKIFYVHNRSGRILWQKKQAPNLDSPLFIKGAIDLYDKVIDLNKDGKNEVLVANVDLNKNHEAYVVCYSGSGNIIWKYRFSDIVRTSVETHSNFYGDQFIDTLTENGKLELFLIARNGPLYPSAIFKLNARTGERLQGTFWHAGHIQNALIENLNNSGKKEIVGLANSNCYECCVLFSLNVDSLDGQGPANAKYTFQSLPRANLNTYILLPKSDVTDYYKSRLNTELRGDLTFRDKKYFEFSLIEGKGDLVNNSIVYDIDKKFSNIKISITDQFQVLRDSLVAKGKLNKPFSNTQEYTNILKRQIKYWDGKEFKRMY